MSETNPCYGVHVTTDREAALAVSKARARRDAWRTTEHLKSPEEAAIVAARRACVLTKLMRADVISAAQFTAGKTYAEKWEACSGLLSRGQLDDGPPGDAASAWDHKIDAGKFLSRCHAVMTDEERGAVMDAAVRGLSLSRSFRGRMGRQPNVREMAKEQRTLADGLEKIARVQTRRMAAEKC